MTFFFWSQNFRKWPLEVMAHEELVKILGLGKPLGSLGNNQSESKVPRLQGDLQKWLFSSEARISENGLWRLLMCDVVYNQPFCFWKSPKIPFCILPDTSFLLLGLSKMELKRRPKCLDFFSRIWTSISCAVTSRGHFLKFWLQKKKVIFEGHPVDEAL